jgi:hypothetical protein
MAACHKSREPERVHIRKLHGSVDGLMSAPGDIAPCSRRLISSKRKAERWWQQLQQGLVPIYILRSEVIYGVLGMGSLTGQIMGAHHGIMHLIHMLLIFGVPETSWMRRVRA